MRYRFRLTCVLAVLAGGVGTSEVYADQHAVICQSPSQAKELVQIVDHAPKPVKIGEVLLAMRTKALRCTVVFADIEYKAVVETVSLSDDDYDIIRVTVNNREYFSFKRQKGERS